ncbi:MAG: 5-methylthioribose kinase [Candidatus Latescibacterota bacterium]|jgi:5-methylthioribose kinase
MTERKALYTLLDIDDIPGVEAYLRERGWLEDTERVEALTRAGEGNMNCTLRVNTTTRSFIAKQSRPWVEKYPDIAAPEERVLMEAMFYQAVGHHTEIAERMPRLLDCDEENYVVLLEDLGETADFTSIYNDGQQDVPPLRQLCRWLAALHEVSFAAETRRQLENRSMRQLNHEHLYHFPLLADNGLDLDAITPGLKERAVRLISNASYVRAISELGQLYLQDGGHLLHGDFYPGSWVHSSDDVWVIDPEFCFFGRSEFDVGIIIAHLLLAARPLDYAGQVFDYYAAPSAFSNELALRFAGMEIMRRLIGVAQLPLAAGLEFKTQLLDLSEQLLLEPQRFSA